jgi:hypothetical protein
MCFSVEHERNMMYVQKSKTGLNQIWAVLFLSGFAAHSVDLQTGEPLLFRPPAAGGSEMVHYFVDWGDGTLQPTAHGDSGSSPLLRKVWKRRGDYTITPFAMTRSGTVIQLEAEKVSVRGRTLEPDAALSGVRFSQNSADGELLDQMNPDASDEPYRAQSIGVRFDQPVSIDTVGLTQADRAFFPDNFRVEYSTDSGAVWQDIPASGYPCFPDPGKNEVRIPLNGLAADAIRIISYRPPQDLSGRYVLNPGSLNVTGSEELLFEMDVEPRTEADWNNLWLIYGAAANEIKYDFVGYPHPTGRPDEGGMLLIGSTIWAHWNSMKLSWLHHPSAKAYFEKTVNSYPQDEQGLMGVSPGSFYHLDHSKHYVTPAIFISGIAHWFLMHRDEAFLQTRDKKSGMALLEKMRKAMRYQLEDLHGETGVLTIRDPEHDGTPSGKPGNYWDVWRFGYKSAYANLLFYQSLDWMARLETALGNPSVAGEYRNLRAKVKKRFNETFWNKRSGRFIGWEDINGSRQDYGFTWVNLEAVACGIASEEHALSVLNWLDGNRKIYADTSTGEDIYYWKIAPRSNTVAAEENPAYWDSWSLPVGAGTQGEYGGQIQNGGHIFYVSYYDLMSRLRINGVQDAMRRMNVILDEFHTDQLRRKPGNRLGSTHVEGILREFPESGLVPLFFVTGILGLEPDADGLRIAPSLPEGWSFAAINEYWFAGNAYRIQAERHLERPSVNNGEIRIPAEGRWRLTPGGAVEELR